MPVSLVGEDEDRVLKDELTSEEDAARGSKRGRGRGRGKGRGRGRSCKTDQNPKKQPQTSSAQPQQNKSQQGTKPKHEQSVEISECKDQPSISNRKRKHGRKSGELPEDCAEAPFTLPMLTHSLQNSLQVDNWWLLGEVAAHDAAFQEALPELPLMAKRRPWICALLVRPWCTVLPVSLFSPLAPIKKRLLFCALGLPVPTRGGG